MSLSQFHYRSLCKQWTEYLKQFLIGDLFLQVVRVLQTQSRHWSTFTSLLVYMSKEKNLYCTRHRPGIIFDRCHLLIICKNNAGKWIAVKGENQYTWIVPVTLVEVWRVHANLFSAGLKDRVLRNTACSPREMGIKSEGVLRGDWWKIIILLVWTKLYRRSVFDKSVLLFGLMINGLHYWIRNIK